MSVPKRLYSPTGKPRDRAVATHSREIRQMETATLRTLRQMETSIAAAQAAADAAGSTAANVLVDIDFATLADNTFADGAETIDGASWTVRNSAAATTFDIANGTGLRFVSNATSTEFHNTTRTAAHLGVVASTLIPNFDPTGIYLIEAYFTALTFVSANNRVHVGVTRDTAGTDRFAACGFGNDGGDRSAHVQVDASRSATEQTTHNCAVARISPTGIETYSGVYDAGFPEPADLVANGVGTFGTTTVSGVGVLDPLSSEIVVAFRTSTTTPGMTITVRRLRITRL